MPKEILRKLGLFLAERKILATSPNVMYLMVELRKLLDHMKKMGDKRFPVIRFYADWIVHIRKDQHINEAREFLEDALGGFTGIKSVEKLITFIGMHELLDELHQILSELGLSTEFLGNRAMSVTDIPSSSFIRALAEVLKDQPLELPKTDSGIRSIRIVKISEFGIDVEVLYDVIVTSKKFHFTLTIPSIDQIRDMERSRRERRGQEE
jgi:hypothetical protein